jgi:hypothetical protein
VHLGPGASAPSQDIFSGLLYQELSISADTTEVSLGYRQVYLPAARADREAWHGTTTITTSASFRPAAPRPSSGTPGQNPRPASQMSAQDASCRVSSW